MRSRKPRSHGARDWRHLAVIVVLIVMPTLAPGASAAHVHKHARAAAAPSRERLAPVLSRMRAEEGVSPGGAPQLEKGEQAEAEPSASPAVTAARSEPPTIVRSTTPGLAIDALVNLRTASCAGCQNKPIAQDEPSVALTGSDVLVSFNDLRYSCGTSTRQNFAYSTDGGATYTDGNGMPIATDGGNVFGDASVDVNAKTGEFYVAGLYKPNGVGALRGHFGGSSFIWDGGHNVAASAPLDFYDKPWMRVDSLSGNVYFTWTNFDGAGNTYVGFRRCGSDLTPLGPTQVLNDTTVGNGVSFSQIGVGPAGELYVAWLQYWLPTGVAVDGPTQVAVRRSNDFGATWGPVAYVAPPHASNQSCGGPGFLRLFAATQPTMAVDRSAGPHRGRVYVAWDASLDYLSAPMPLTTTLFESEPNNTPLTANLLVPGGKLRGNKTGTEEDWFRIDLNAGDTYYQTNQNILFTGAADSTSAEVSAQIYAPDLSGNLHLAANTTAVGSLLYSAPRTASYYLRLFGTTAATRPYVLVTTLIPAGTSNEPARDARDQLASWSDDGTTWSTPMRINDSPPGADAQYPSLAVDGRGRVYCGFMDWRDDQESGTASTQYVVMSGDGGMTWGANVRAGDAVSGWSTNVCVSNGNTQGDYEMMATDGDRVALAFTDARLGDPDIFIDQSVFTATASAPSQVSAGADTWFQMMIRNGGNFTRQLSWSLTDGAGWLAGTTSGSPTLAAGDSVPVSVSLHPTGVTGDSTVVKLALGDPLIPGYADTAITVAHLAVPVSVPPTLQAALYFAPPEPTPSHGPVTLRFGLPTAGRVQVSVYSVQGACVRTLVDGPSNAGPHTLAWDGRDARGAEVPAGVYLVRLKTPRGSIPRRVVVTR